MRNFTVVTFMALLASSSAIEMLRSQKWFLRSVASSLLAISTTTPHAIAADTTSELNYGIVKGRLLKCKTQSNCISSTSVNSVEKYGRPWEYSTTADDVFNRISTLIQTDKSLDLKLVEQDKTQNYIRAEGKSAFPPNGVDDVEFQVKDADKIVSYRSNSRDAIKAGTQLIPDGGANKNRMMTMRKKLALREMDMSDETEQFIKREENLLYFQRLRENSLPNEINFIDNSVPDSAPTENLDATTKQ